MQLRPPPPPPLGLPPAPWQLLPNLVLRLRQSGAAALVLVPAWHGRPWLQQLADMATEVLHYPPSRHLFYPR